MDDGAASSPFPRALRRFVGLVNEGSYWESHEALEGAWRTSGSDFYRGLILYASAFVHARRGTPHGIVAQMEKAEAALAGYPDAYLGLDVDGIRRHARQCREAVATRRAGLDREGEAAVDWASVVTFPRLELRPARIRGDEPEASAPD